MTTLILSPFFYPEPISTGKYNTVLAHGLVARGQEVVVLASHPLYPRWQPEQSNATLPGTTVIRGGAWLRYPSSAMLRRLMLETWYAGFACIQYLRLPIKPGYVIPVFPPSLFFLILSMLLRRSSNVVGIVHDLQGVYAKKSSSVLGRLLQVGIHWVERRCFARCHRLVFLSRSMKDLAVAEYGLDREACVVCYPFVALSPAGCDLGIALAGVLSADFIQVVYSGALGDKQNPDGLFGFMEGLAQSKADVRCHIFSAGPHFERLKARGANKQDRGITFHDLVPAEQVDELYARSAVQIIPQADGTGDGSLPSKLPNLLAAGVPIFAVCDSQSELGYLVEKAKAGVVVRSWEFAVMAAQFDVLLSSLESEIRDERKVRQKVVLEEHFSVDAVVNAVLAA